MVDNTKIQQQLSILDSRAGIEQIPSPNVQLEALQARARQAETDDNLARGLVETVVAFGAGTNQGIANVAGLPVDAVNGLLGFLGLPVSNEPFGGSASIARAFEFGGASTTPSDETLSQRIAGRLGEEIGAAALPGGLALRGAQGARAATSLFEPIFSLARTRPLAFAGGEAAVAAGAGLGAATAQEVAPGSVGAEITGQLIGGLGPSAIATGIRTGVNQAANTLRSFTDSGARQEAATRLQSQAVDPSAASQSISENRNLFPSDAVPTAAQLTGDSGLLALERAVIRSRAELRGQFDQALTSTNQAIRADMTALRGSGSVELAQDHFQNRLDNLTDLLDVRTQQAVSAAQRRVDEASPRLERRQANLIAREELEKALQDTERQESDLWNAVDLTQDVGTEDLKQAATDIIERRRRADLPANTPTDVIEVINDFGSLESAAEIQALRSRLLQQMRAERARGGEANRRLIANLNELQDASLSLLRRIGGADEALSFSRELNETYRRGPIGSLLSFSTGGAQRVPDLLTLERLVLPGPRGEVNVTALMDAAAFPGSPQIRDQVEFATRNFILAEFFRSATDRAGQIAPASARRFIERHSDVLNRFPDLQGQLSDLTEAQNFANTMQRSGQRLKDTVLNQRKSRAALFIGQRPDRAFQRVLSSPRPIEVTRQLVRLARSDPTGDAERGLRAGFMDLMIGRSELKVLDEAGDRRIFGRELTSFLNDNERLMLDSGLFTPDEVGRVRQVAEAARRVDRSLSAPAGAGSDTAQNMNILVDAMGRIAGARIGAQLGTTPLISAGLGARLARVVVGDLPEARIRNLIEAAIFDPDLMEDLLTTVTPGNARELQRRLRGHLLNLETDEE